VTEHKLVHRELWAFLHAKGFPSTMNREALRKVTFLVERQACASKRLELMDWDFAEGGLHSDDVALVVLLAEALGLNQGVDWDWGLELDDYHFEIAYRSSPKLQGLFRLLDLYHEACLAILITYHRAENMSPEKLQQRFRERGATSKKKSNAYTRRLYAPCKKP